MCSTNLKRFLHYWVTIWHSSNWIGSNDRIEWTINCCVNWVGKYRDACYFSWIVVSLLFINYVYTFEAEQSYTHLKRKKKSFIFYFIFVLVVHFVRFMINFTINNVWFYFHVDSLLALVWLFPCVYLSGRCCSQSVLPQCRHLKLFNFKMIEKKEFILNDLLLLLLFLFFS